MNHALGFSRQLLTAALMTIATTVIFGMAYPAVVTVLAQMLFPQQANGQLISRRGVMVGSAILAQPFRAPGYFHPRPSAAGVRGYDASASSGSNLGPTSRALVDAVAARVAEARAENPSAPVPIDLVTASGSGLDPDISPAGALFQVPRVARARGLDEAIVRRLVMALTTPRQLGVLGEPRVNVLRLNLALDDQFPLGTR